MKKGLLAAALLLMMALCSGCGGGSYDVAVTVPAGSTGEEIVWSASEISPRRSSVKLSCGENLGECGVYLLSAEMEEKSAYDRGAYLTPGVSAKVEAEKGGWFRVGVSMGNDTEEDVTVFVHVEHVDVRTS